MKTYDERINEIAKVTGLPTTAQLHSLTHECGVQADSVIRDVHLARQKYKTESAKLGKFDMTEIKQARAQDSQEAQNVSA